MDTLRLCRMRRNCFWMLSGAFLLAIAHQLIQATRIVRHREDWLIVLGITTGIFLIAAFFFYIAFLLYKRKTGLIYQELQITQHSPSDKLAAALSSATGEYLLSSIGILAFAGFIYLGTTIFAVLVLIAGVLLFYPQLVESRQHYIGIKQKNE